MPDSRTCQGRTGRTLTKFSNPRLPKGYSAPPIHPKGAGRPGGQSIAGQMTV